MLPPEPRPPLCGAWQPAQPRPPFSWAPWTSTVGMYAVLPLIICADAIAPITATKSASNATFFIDKTSIIECAHLFITYCDLLLPRGTAFDSREEAKSRGKPVPPAES